MLPVTDKNIIELDLNKKSLSKLEEKYNKLLRKQLFWLNRNNNKLYIRYKEIYYKYIT